MLIRCAHAPIPLVVPCEVNSAQADWFVQDYAKRRAARAAAAANPGQNAAAAEPGHGVAAADRRTELRATWEAAKRRVAQPKVMQLSA